MSELTISRLRHDCLEQVLSFLRRHYGDAYYGADERFFRWQYLDVPTQWFAREIESGRMPANGIVADDGDLLAVHVFIPFDGIGCGGIFRGAFDEEWINGSGIPGLGRRLASYLLSEVDVYCGFGCNDLSEKAFKNLCFDFVDEIPRVVAILDSDELRTAVSAAGHEAEVTLFPLSDRVIGDSDFREIAVSNIPEEAIDRHNACLDFGIQRTRAWLQWRYERHPYIKYSLISNPADPAAGIAVVRVENVTDTDSRVARIVDLIGDRSEWGGLFRTALAFARQRNCMLADFFSSSTLAVDALYASLGGGISGLMRNPRVPYMFQPLAFGARNSVNLAINSRVPMPNAAFSAVKADGTQDILRHSASGPKLNRRT